MAGQGRRDDRPEREPVFTDFDASAPHETSLVCDECGLTFLAPPYRGGDKCPSGDADYPCRGRLQSMPV
jgi:hypothetical protein